MKTILLLAHEVAAVCDGEPFDVATQFKCVASGFDPDAVWEAVLGMVGQGVVDPEAPTDLTLGEFPLL